MKDYQYIMHPNKKPIKYGHNASFKQKQSKIAKDDTFIYPPHLKYLQQFEHGRSYTMQRMIYFDLICKQI